MIELREIYGLKDTAMKKILVVLAGVAIIFAGCMGFAQSGEADSEDKDPLSSGTFNAFKLRNIGPAFMSGRIADIAIVQDDPATWYVGVGSGGVWKTENLSLIHI